MAELVFIALIALLLFAAFLMFAFFSYPSFFLNVIILVTLYFLIKRDLKNYHRNRYYIASLLLTALFFISSTSGVAKEFLLVAERLSLSYLTAAAALVYIFANLIAFIYEFIEHKILPYVKKNIDYRRSKR